MKIHIQNQSRKQGSALIITLTFGVILLVVLASYLMLLTSQKTIVTRSQTWNAALTMAEAGIEEGLAQANQNTVINYFTNINQPNNILTNFSNNGWGGSAGVYGPRTNNLLGGSYIATIQYTASPIIYSTGYATVPIIGGSISRQIKIITGLQPLLANAITAKSNLDLTGSGWSTTSMNPFDPTKSTNMQFDPNKMGTNGNIASAFGIIDLGNHTINGNEYLGDGASTSGGTVTGTTFNDFNVQVPDVELPPGASSWPTEAPITVKVGNKNVTEYDFTTPGFYIINQDLPIVVEAGVTVYLNVTSSSFSGSGMTIHGGTTNSGTAALYFNGPTSITISGNTAVDASNLAQNLYYFGLPTLTSITYNGNVAFTGVIYAPEAVFTLNGGGNSVNLIGSATVLSLTAHGGVELVYDESLAKSGPSRGYVATSWEELK